MRLSNVYACVFWPLHSPNQYFEDEQQAYISHVNHEKSISPRGWIDQIITMPLDCPDRLGSVKYLPTHTNAHAHDNKNVRRFFLKYYLCQFHLLLFPCLFLSLLITCPSLFIYLSANFRQACTQNIRQNLLYVFCFAILMFRSVFFMFCFKKKKPTRNSIWKIWHWNLELHW